jgi:uncharacterized membrane protein YbhN (UPF0104 family)
MKALSARDSRRLFRGVLQGVALAGLATAAVFLWTVEPATWVQLRAFRLWWLPVFFSLIGLAWLCNGARIWVLCRALGHRVSFLQALAVTISQEFGIAVTPAGVGSAVLRFGLLARAGVPVARSASMLTTDAALDFLFFLLLTPFACAVVLHDPAFAGLLARIGRRPPLGPLLGGLAALAVLGWAARSPLVHRWLAQRMARTSFGRRRRLPGRHRYLRIRTARALRRVREALVLLWGRRKSALLLSFLFGSLQWIFRYSLLPLVLVAMQAPVNPLPLFLVQGLLFVLSMAVLVPGGGGSVEVLAAVVLPAFVPLALVGPAILVWRLCTYHLYVVAGGTVCFLTFRNLDTLFPPRPAGG